MLEALKYYMKEAFGMSAQSVAEKFISEYRVKRAAPAYFQRNQRG